MKVLILIIILFSARVNANDFINADDFVNSINYKTKESLYFTNLEESKKFETLTYIVTNEEKPSTELGAMILEYSDVIGEYNGVSFLEHKFNKRYNSLMIESNCFDKFNSSNIPVVLYYIRDINKCYAIPYEDEHELTDIFVNISNILKKAKLAPIESKEIYKIKIRKTINTLANKYKTPPDINAMIIELFNEGLNKIFYEE